MVEHYAGAGLDWVVCQAAGLAYHLLTLMIKVKH